MTRFERDTAVVAKGDGRYRTQIDPGWWITHGPNGGYMAALILRGIQDTAGDPRHTPRTLTLHYLSPPTTGEAELTVEVIRTGRSLTVLSARLHQEGKPRVLALAALAAARPDLDCQLEACPIPEVPPASELASTSEVRIPVHERLDTRFIPGYEPMRLSKKAELLAWLRLREACPLDAPQLALYADGLPPAVFALREGERPLGVPTVELTIHFAGDPARAGLREDDFVLARMVSRTVREGFTMEDADIWAPDGRLLCHARQIAALLEPAPRPND